MQGQSSAIGSLKEALSFDHGPTPNETDIDQEICWNNVHNFSPDPHSEYDMHHNTDNMYLNPIVCDGQNLRAWSMDEPGLSDVPIQISHDEQKAEHVWVSTSRACPSGHTLENQQHELASDIALNNVNLNSNQIADGPLLMQCSSTTSVSQDLNVDAGSEGQGIDDCQIVERPLVFRSASENLRMSTRSSSSSPFNLQSGEYVEESNSRTGSSLEGCNLSRKRKTTENVGQSSGVGNPSYFQHAESSVWRAIPAPRNTSSSLSISAPSVNTIGGHQSEHVNPSLALGVGSVSSDTSPTFSAAGSTEISHRNLRLRINSHQQDSLPSNVFTVGNTDGSSSITAPHQGALLLPHDDSLSPPPEVRSLLVHVPAMRRNLQSSRWTRSSSSRAGRTSGLAIEGDTASSGESSSRSVSRNRSEHPISRSSVVRESAQSRINLSSTGGNVSVSGNAASSSQGGAAGGNRQGSGLNWFPDRDSLQYPRRLSELVRRSLLSASGPESEGQNIDNSSSRSSNSDSDQEMPFLSEGQGRFRSRSAMLLDRHLDGASRISQSLRTLAAASEGRSRLVSEIRDVLDLMRRGEGLRFEDLMILDQSAFYGMGDHHDRHRDMRLDVDNMTYEELLALEERIGNVNTGVSEETISSRLKQSKYALSATTGLQEIEPCCICQDEYNNGDDLGELECGHGFHAECIKKWLTCKNLCPICKTTAMGDKEKE